MKRLLCWILLGGWLAGCASGLVEEKPPVLFYDLDAPAAAVECAAGFDRGVRVWVLSASAPYDRTDMVVRDRGEQVLFSGRHNWVAPPGRLVADTLLRDWSGSDLFFQTGAADSPVDLPLELSGRIYEFAWVRSEEGPKAVLHVEFSLVDTAAGTVLFRRGYRLESPPASGDDAVAFARSMSLLVRDLSLALQRDLCEAASVERKAGLGADQEPSG